MDGQNANGGGFPLNQNPTPQNPNAANDSGAFFSAAQNAQQVNAAQGQQVFNPYVMPAQGSAQQPMATPAPALENIRSSSMIQSERDNVQAQLDKMHAQNMAATRRVRRRATMEGVTRKGVKILVVIIIIIIFSLIAVIGFSLYLTMQKPRPISHCEDDNSCSVVDPDPDPDPDPGVTDKTKIGEYECESTDCVVLADMPDGRKVVRDASIIIVNPNSRDVLPTTIPVQQYDSVVAASWGNRIVISLKNDKGAGLYSVEEARMMIDFGYDSFILDPNDGAYTDQTWIVNDYVIARKNNEYRMISLSDGVERISGVDRVFTYEGVYFEGISGEQRKFFAGGQQIAVAAPTDSVYIYKTRNWLLHITAKEGSSRAKATATAELVGAYDANGNSVAGDKDYQSIQKSLKSNKDINAYGPFDDSESCYRMP